MTDQPREHWNRVYSDKAPSEVSWFQSEPRPSLAALARFAVPPISLMPCWRAGGAM
jgi:hypothetical protein